MNVGILFYYEGSVLAIFFGEFVYFCNVVCQRIASHIERDRIFVERLRQSGPHDLLKVGDKFVCHRKIGVVLIEADSCDLSY